MWLTPDVGPYLAWITVGITVHPKGCIWGWGQAHANPNCGSHYFMHCSTVMLRNERDTLCLYEITLIHNFLIWKYLISTISLDKINQGSDSVTIPFLKWFYSHSYVNKSINIISCLPLSHNDSSTSTNLCKSIWPFRQRTGPISASHGHPWESGGKVSHPLITTTSAQHHNITHETFTSLCGQDDHASLPLAETGSAQSRRWGSIGVVGSQTDGSTVRKLDRSISPHRWVQGQELCCRVS